MTWHGNAIVAQIQHLSSSRFTFLLEGLFSGAALGFLLGWFPYLFGASQEFCKKAMLITIPIGAIIGCIIT